jgi:hypothetical protein
MMKLVLLFVALSFAGCSSKEKAAPKAEATAIVEEKAAGATPVTSEAAVKKEKKEKLKKIKAVAAEATEASTTTTSTETTTTSSDSSFPGVTGTEKSSVSCTSKGGDSRKISVLSTADGGCGVVYNKAGEDKTVAVAKANLGHCDTVATKIQSNLEGAGYDCGGSTAAPAKTESAPQ